MGNRQSVASELRSDVSQSYEYTNNYWLKSVETDANGNTTQSNGNVDIYDFENRLIKRTKADGTIITITSDADGKRVAKSVVSADSTNTTYFTVDSNNLTGYAQVFEELAEFGTRLTMKRRYTFGLDMISQEIMSGENLRGPPAVSYYLYDGGASVRGLADASGTVTDSYTYDAFGNLLATTGSTSNLYLYHGELIKGTGG